MKIQAFSNWQMIATWTVWKTTFVTCTLDFVILNLLYYLYDYIVKNDEHFSGDIVCCSRGQDQLKDFCNLHFHTKFVNTTRIELISHIIKREWITKCRDYQTTIARISLIHIMYDVSTKLVWIWLDNKK